MEHDEFLQVIRCPFHFATCDAVLRGCKIVDISKPLQRRRLSKKVRSPLGPLCEGAPPAGGGGENCTAARNISGYGKVLSLRPFGAPPSQREARRSQPANRDTRSAGFLLFGAQWAIIVLYVHTAHTTYNKEGLSREYIHYDENCRIDPVG